MKAKLGFRNWLICEQLKKSISEAVDGGEFPDKVFAYLSAASVAPKEDELWEKTVILLLDTFKENQPTARIPFLDAPADGKEKPSDWDYSGRSWPFWGNIFSKTYGWSLEYIANLDLDEALALAQEILTDEQLEKEWQYSLSELAYPYNSSTKKSAFKPLPRPYWMRPTVPKVKVQKFKREYLPVGNVIDISGMPLEFNPLRDSVQTSDLPAQ